MAAGGKEERGRRWDLVKSSRKKGFHRGSLHRGQLEGDENLRQQIGNAHARDSLR
jgi:hypothetical protein